MSHRMASVKQLELSLDKPVDETVIGERKEDASVRGSHLMERVVERENLRRALQQVIRNGGSPGIDGMTAKELPLFLREHWLEIKQSLLTGTYKAKAVLRVEIPKSGGGKRNLGIPVVLDRFIQQALLQVLQEAWDSTFSNSSFGFRPGRSAHQAIERVQQYIHKGYGWVVDMDLEKFFDRVNHEELMKRIKQRISDYRILKLINSFLKSGVMINGARRPTQEGTPQGGPLSPLLSNLLLDDLDKELERRGHHFARYADDCNIYLKSKIAGLRVMSSISRYLKRKLKLKVNEAKSAVDRPGNLTFLGFTFSRGRNAKRKVSKKAIKSFKEKIRKVTMRTRGYSIKKIISDLKPLIIGWRNYFGITEVITPLKELDRWIRRRLRCYIWKQWGRSGYKKLRELKVSAQLAWNTSKSAHGPWRLSRSPALCLGLSNKFFKTLGLSSLIVI